VNWKVAVPVIAGVVTAVITDLDAWLASDDGKNDLPNFKWRLCFARAFRGGLAGLLIGLGYNAA